MLIALVLFMDCIVAFVGTGRMSFASDSSDSCYWAVLVFLVASHR